MLFMLKYLIPQFFKKHSKIVHASLFFFALQIVVLKSTADLWVFIETEKAARKRRAEEAAAEKAAERAKPRSQRKWVINPWKSLVR